MNEKARLNSLFARFRQAVSKKPLDVKHVAFHLIVDSEPNEPDALELEMVLDDKRWKASSYGPIDLFELEKANNTEGTYFIWACSCGAPGCAGRFKGVAVTHDGDDSVWHDRDLKVRYRLNREQLGRAFDAVVDEARRMMAERPELVWTPENNAEFFAE